MLLEVLNTNIFIDPTSGNIAAVAAAQNGDAVILLRGGGQVTIAGQLPADVVGWLNSEAVRTLIRARAMNETQA